MGTSVAQYSQNIYAVKILTSAHPSGSTGNVAPRYPICFAGAVWLSGPLFLSTPGNAVPASRDAPVASLCSALGLTLG